VLKKKNVQAIRRGGWDNDLVFQTLAESGLKPLSSEVKKNRGYRPHCVARSRTTGGEVGIAPEIEHHSEFMARHKDRLPKQESGESIVYHDRVLGPLPGCLRGAARDCNHGWSVGGSAALA